MLPRWLLGLLAVLALLWAGWRTLDRPPAVTNPRPASDVIVCFGDSLTAGTGADPDQSYPAHLARRLGRAVINAGVPGDTTATALARLDRDVLVHRPGFVCLTLGGNDLKNGVDRAEAFANLEAIVRRLHASGALVVLGGIEVPLFGRGWADGYRELARRTGSVLIPNVYKGLLGDSRLMSDPIHPNGRGYEIMARHFHRALAPYLP